MNERERVWLDRLLSLEQEEQNRELQRLGTTQPELQARLAELLSDAAANSQEFMQPVLKALDRIVQSSMVMHEPGSSLAGYRLLREIGRGGMSVVWLAERMDGVIKRTIALKLPLYTLTSPADVARFAREKDVLASLTHPNIARLYDAGVSDAGQPFLVLEYVEGIPITKYCEQHHLSIRARLQLFLQALAAVDDAHRHLIVHLDLKPSNILVDSSGQIKLLDFGIARLVTDTSSLEEQSTIVRARAVTSMAMTALYAAPEQALGAALSTLTDVYALGVLLHEILTGTSPYAHGATVPIPRLLASITAGETVPPSKASFNNVIAAARGLSTARQLQSKLKGDLDAIVAHALRPEPAERYRSVERLAADLKCFLSDEPISARKSEVLHRVGLFLRRHRAASAAAAAGTLLSLVAATAALQQYHQSVANEADALRMKTFMFDLANTAEPDESQDSEITAKQMIDSSVDGARARFKSEPRLQGELLAELGNIYASLGHPELAEPVIQEGLRILEASQPSGDAVLNRARALRAGIYMRRTQVDEARRLATQARNECREQSSTCARARTAANYVLTTLYRRDGRIEASLQAMREVVKDVEIGWEQSSELAEALGHMALVMRNAGRPVEAEATIQRAVRLSQSLKLTRTQRATLLRNAAMIDLDLGRYQQARTRLLELQSQTTDRGEIAYQWRLLAGVYLAEGNAQWALDASVAAIEQADPAQEANQLLFAQQARAQALALLGEVDEAAQQMQAVSAGLNRIGYSSESPEVLRAHRLHAEILLRMGRATPARDELEGLLATMRGLPDVRTLELGQTLDLLGCAQRELKNLDAAKRLHAEARTHLERILPGNHPFLIRNTLYRLAAAENLDQLRQAAAVIELSPHSVWRVLLNARLGADACRGMCTFVLW